MKRSFLLASILIQACAPSAFAPTPQAPTPTRMPADPASSEAASAPTTTGASQPPATPGEPPPPGAEAPVTAASIAAKYRDDVRKCMRGEAVDGGSMVGGGTCAALRRAARSGDASELPKGAAGIFEEERGH